MTGVKLSVFQLTLYSPVVDMWLIGLLVNRGGRGQPGKRIHIDRNQERVPQKTTCSNKNKKGLSKEDVTGCITIRLYFY